MDGMQEYMEVQEQDLFCVENMTEWWKDVSKDEVTRESITTDSGVDETDLSLMYFPYLSVEEGLDPCWSV